MADKVKAGVKQWLLALLLLPIFVFGGNLIHDAVATWLDGDCVQVGSDAVLCIHKTG